MNDFLWNTWRPDDGAWELAEELKDRLEEGDDDEASSSNATATIVYVHCMRGIDRTGLVVGAYLARYGGGSGDGDGKNVNNSEWEDIIHRMNYDVGKRDINWPARNALRWVFWRRKQEIKDRP